MDPVIEGNVQIFEGKRYYLCGEYWQRKGVRLHRTVWSSKNGQVPKGFHVHHKNKDKSDNRLENLELVRAEKHLSAHSSEPERVVASRKNMLEVVQKYAAEWHGSEKGREWHCRHYEANCKDKIQAREMRTCDWCHGQFEALVRTGDGENRFCSGKCKAAWRRASGVDDETRNCAECGEEFTVNKYSRVRTCGKTSCRVAA